MKIAMIGGGYVGLVSAACLAGFGYEVVCVERDSARVELLRQNRLPFYEPGLEALLGEGLNAGRLRFSTDLPASVSTCALVFIAVGTPMRGVARQCAPSGGAGGSAPRKETGVARQCVPPEKHAGDSGADLSDVRSAVEAVAAALQPGCVVVMKSTVPVGTADIMEARIAELRPDLDFDLVSNPEFLRQGEAIEDFVHPDRVVVGVASSRARAVMEALYHPFARKETPILFTDRRTAELSKYAANTFLAAKIALIGEIADLCEARGADVETVARVVGSDKRIASGFLRPGPGFGGSCLPKDTKALLSMARECGLRCHAIEAVVEANQARKQGMAARIIRAAGGDVRGMEIGILGVTFKPETDDMRAAPSLEILPALQAAGARVRAYDPQGMKQAAKLLDGIDWKEDCQSALEGAHVAVILTEWAEFRSLDFAALGARMAGNVLVDLRNIYRGEDVAAAGLEYHSIGRQSLKAAKAEETDAEAGQA